MSIELQPDIEEVLQVEQPEPAVAVTVVGPVRTQALPTKSAATFTKTVGTTPTRLLRRDHFRAGAYVISYDQDIWIAFSSASAQDTSRMARWPAGTPFPTQAGTAIVVAAVTGTTQVSVIAEYWAAGDGGE
jgi:hypothetical protein